MKAVMCLVGAVPEDLDLANVHGGLFVDLDRHDPGSENNKYRFYVLHVLEWARHG